VRLRVCKGKEGVAHRALLFLVIRYFVSYLVTLVSVVPAFKRGLLHGA